MNLPLDKSTIIRGLTETGITSGDNLLVHSAMRTVGRIEGGAETMVDALLDVVGERGTLIVPTFTFIHEVEDDPIIDPRLDRSEMGAISEAARTRPEAMRSVAFRHSFSAIGRRAQIITDIDPALSVFDLRSSFGMMLGLNIRVLMLGMGYSSSTSHHFAEWMCEVPYRHTIDLKVRVRRNDGSLEPQAMLDYQPQSYAGSRHTDFNRLGCMLEQQGKVGVGIIGNAVARCYALRDLIDLAQVEAEKDYNVFRTAEGQGDSFTPLEFGKILLSPEMLDGAGRASRYQWCVADESKLTLPPGS